MLVGSSPAQFRQPMLAEIIRWKNVAAENGI